MDTSQNNLSSNVITRTAVAAVVGGTASALGGGSFANGAYTAAFQHLFNAESGGIARGLAEFGKGVLDVAGKIWNLPNTAIGLAWGAVGAVAETVTWLGGGGWNFGVSLGNNSIQFTGHNLAGSAQALGNTTHSATAYAPGKYNPYEGHTYGDHERMHTYQGQQLGPLYLPAVAASYIASYIGHGTTHGPLSFVERGPQTYGEPQVWNFGNYYDPYRKFRRWNK